MKEIKLTRGLVTQVDDEDYEYLSQWKWFAMKSRNTFYAVRSRNGTAILIHRIIMNVPTNLQTDHIDHNGLNNQKSNLRLCNNTQNQQNRMKWGKSKYKGVNLQRGKYYAAQIRINGKLKHLGSYKTEIDAALAYDIKAKELFGEFAHLNFKL